MDIIEDAPPEALREPETNRSFVVLAPGTIASDFALQSLSKALGEAQNEFLPSVKSVENEYAHYDYVPLEAIVAAVRPSLCKYHLTVSQFSVTDLETKTIAVYTRLVHWDSGEWMQNMMELPAEMALGKEGALKFNQQTIGGSQTYGQKYPYKAIVGIPDSEGDPDSKDESGDLKARSTKNKKAAPCPECGKDTIIKGKEEYGGGWLCYKAKGGCGAKFDKEPQGENISKPAGASTANPTTQPSTQRAAASPAAKAGQAGVLRFIPPNGLTAVIARVKEIEGFPARAATAELPAMKAVRARMIVTLCGEHNGVSETSCFDTKLWPALHESVGLECHFQIAEKDSNGKHYINIEDIIYVDGEEYSNGVPVQGGQQ